MKKTKDKIILAAVEQFNEKGVFNARNQDIADSAGMSLSNFNYHYKNKDELVDAVFSYMMDVAEKEVYLNNIHILKGSAYGLLISYLKFQYQFRFFYLDSFNITDSFPRIKGKYHEKVNAAKMVVKNMIFMEVGRGQLKPFRDNGEEVVDELIELLWCKNHFLLQYMSLVGDESNFIDKGISSTYFILTPYMSEQGLKDLAETKTHLNKKNNVVI